ncbi:BCAM0308 family protein [Geomonas sp.]|uniref:BCAM0308 family protein n=1 Tax=Geomonas sp. TaxID=2651584 RepID=UPI002B469B57|nr:BCAM0308 family protein [Geomonas sp.]HJV36174.1 BCAM0308 family protein [Geomonas sp.]
MARASRENRPGVERVSKANRTGVEEKGLRTVRSLDVYLPKRGLPEGAHCKGCGITYHNKRWQIEGVEQGASCEVLCPACQRMEDHNPGGVVTLSGPYLAVHKEEILNAIRQQEAKSREKNPIGRIMEIKEDNGQITVTTTEDKLAQKLGREVFRSQKGELHYQWSHDQRMVRVEWMR